MNKEKILIEFQEAEAILKGHFLLSSGLHSDTYLQCARVLMDAKRADRLCGALAKKVRESEISGFDIIVAPAMGGVVVGYEMGRQLGVRSIFCERVEGEFTLRRGFDIAQGANVLVVEDVVTTGKSSREAIACIESYGGNVVAEACLVERCNPGQEEIDLGVPLISLIQLEVSSYSENTLPEALAEIPAVKPGSRGLK